MSEASPFTTTRTSTWPPLVGSPWLLSVELEDDHYVVSERRTSSYGSGDSLRAAFLDFASAVEETEAVLAERRLTPRLRKELAEIRRLLNISPASSAAARESA